jgi:hypothetical protein
LSGEMRSLIHVCDDFIFVERTFVRHHFLHERERESEDESGLNDRFLGYVHYFCLQ